MWSDQEPEDPPGGGAQRALQQNEDPERCSWPGPLLAYDLKPNKTKKNICQPRLLKLGLVMLIRWEQMICHRAAGR